MISTIEELLEENGGELPGYNFIDGEALAYFDRIHSAYLCSECAQAFIADYGTEYLHPHNVTSGTVTCESCNEDIHSVGGRGYHRLL